MAVDLRSKMISTKLLAKKIKVVKGAVQTLKTRIFVTEKSDKKAKKNVKAISNILGREVTKCSCKNKIVTVGTTTTSTTPTAVTPVLATVLHSH